LDMIVLAAGCGPACGVMVQPHVRSEGAALAGRRLLGLDNEGGSDDDEEASMEGWLQKRREANIVRWLWQSRWFRLEPGPQLLSFYPSHIWQSCRREGAFDLTRLVGARTRLRRDGVNAALCLELSTSSASAHSVIEDVEELELRVLGGMQAAQDWEARLLRCIEEALLHSCDQCAVYDGLADTAAKILVRAQLAAAEGRAHIDVNHPRQAGTGATALMLAAQAGHERLCTYLLMARADAGLQNFSEQSAVDIALVSGHEGILSLLKSAGADAKVAQQSLPLQALGPTVLGVPQEKQSSDIPAHSDTGPENKS